MKSTCNHQLQAFSRRESKFSVLLVFIDQRMHLFIFLLFVIPFTSVLAQEKWPKNLNNLTMYENETSLDFTNLKVQYMSSDLLNRFRAAQKISFQFGLLDKVFLKPELSSFHIYAARTSEVEIDSNKSYETRNLSISHCWLKTLPQYLNRLTKLEALSLDANQIETVNMDNINELKNLRKLSLAWNSIKVFGATTDISLPSLERLSLGWNNISMLEICNWYLPKLTVLFLGSNNLSHIKFKPRVFNETLTIFVSAHSLDCDWLHQFRAKIRTIELGDGTSCTFQNKTDIPIFGCAESKCGQQQWLIVETIVHGQDTARGFWPWHAAVYRNDGTQMNYACGGTLISTDFVLTAAHCVVTGTKKRLTISNELLQVQLGMHILDQVDPETQEFKVQKIYQYGNFTTLVDDISLLQLHGRARLSAFVQPICIDYSGDLIDQYGTVVGWGLRSDDKVASVLQSSRMPVHGMLTCLISNRPLFGKYLNHGIFCAGYLNGTSVCNGDSGGGLYFQRDNSWFVGGIVSFSAFRANNRGLCKTDSYGAFTNVSHYASWINRTIGL